MHAALRIVISPMHFAFVALVTLATAKERGSKMLPWVSKGSVRLVQFDILPTSRALAFEACGMTKTA